MPYYKLFTSSSPSIFIAPLCMPAVLSVPKHQDTFPPSVRSITDIPPLQEEVVFPKKKKNGMRGPDFYFHYDCEENIWPFHQRQNRWLAKAHTYQLFLPVCVCYTELLWSVNCFYCFRGSTKKEDNIRLPNASNKQVKRRGFMKSLRKVSIGPG